MCITYEVENSLYVNITNKCSNRCVFCIRNNGDSAYGSDPLWLEREPTLKEIVDSILSRDLSRYSEIVFCGYGEPSVRLREARAASLAVKEKHPEVKIRINTNGQSDLILGYDTAPFYKDAFDAVSISLNAPTAEKYDKVCQSAFGKAAFDSILNFAKKVKNYVPNVAFSVVDEALTDEEIEECKKIADSCGVKLRVRKYIGK
ncbi:MAG: radical SAM protein [Clostridia bacterium]|nr:radical SAM protein [Clostridia bacterium]